VGYFPLRARGYGVVLQCVRASAVANAGIRKTLVGDDRLTVDYLDMFHVRGRRAAKLKLR